MGGPKKGRPEASASLASPQTHHWAHTGFQKRRFQAQIVGGVKWLAYSEIHEGAFCKWRVVFAPDVVSRSAKALGM